MRRPSSIRVSRLAGLLLLLFIVRFSVTLSNAEDRRRRTVKIEDRASLPRIETRLLKRHVPKARGGWPSSMEYKFSDAEDRNGIKIEDREAAKISPKVGEGDPKIPKLGSRTIFTVPMRPCPPGQMRDQRNTCREVILFEDAI